MMAATLPHQPAPAVSEQPSHMIEAQLSQPPFQPSSEQQLGPQAAQPACSTCAAARRDSVMPGSMARRMLIPSTKSQLRAVSTNQTFPGKLATQLAALDKLQAAQPFGDPVLASALCRSVCNRAVTTPFAYEITLCTKYLTPSSAVMPRHFAVGALSTRNPSRVLAFQDRLEYDFKVR